MKIKRTFNEKARRGIAALLVSSMTFSTLSSIGMLTSYAAELPSEDLGGGAGSNTAYTWKSAKGASEPGSATWRFDLRGFSARGQDSYANAGLKTTYGNDQIDGDGLGGGYATWISPTNRYNAAGAVKVNPLGNGMVYEIDTTSAPAGVTPLGRLEYRMVVEPSPDDQYIFVNYYIYNKESNQKTVYLGSGADVQIGTDDRASIYKTDTGIRMVNSDTTKSDYLSTFELICKDSSSNLGVTDTDTTWIGDYEEYWTNLFVDGATQSLTDRETDTGIAYSWKFELRPYELVHKRVAFTVRPTSYYVHSVSGLDSNAGTNSSPLKTIDAAVNKLSGKMGYIYIMDDQMLEHTIDIGSGSGTSITIESTNYNIDGTSANTIRTLTRASGFTGSLFSTSGAYLTFNNIKLDGNKNLVTSIAPLISASAGSVALNSDVQLLNNRVSTSVGSAVDLTGSASLDINYAKITGNVSTDKGAVYYNSSGAFTVRNSASVTGNTNSSTPAENANVYLADGKYLTITAPLTETIGITTETEPEAEDPDISDGSLQASGTYVTVVSESGSGSVTDPTYYLSNFTADTTDRTGVYVTEDTSTAASKNVVLKRNGLELTRIYIDEQNNEIATSSSNYYGVEQSVTLPLETITDYQFVSAVISQGSYSTLSMDSSSTLTGTMPNTSVTVTYTYKQNSSGITFHSNYGTPEPVNLSGTVGSAVGSLIPTIAKYGYSFLGWYDTNNTSGTRYISSNFPTSFPSSPLDLYAIWAPDNNVTFEYVVQHTNADESIIFYTTDPPSEYPVEYSISAMAATVPGYELVSGTVNPSQYEGVDVGNFTPDFNGTMPNLDTKVTYKYAVDFTQQKQRLTVKYVSTTGSQVQALSEQYYHPEEAISVTPISAYGYDLTDWSVTAGGDADPANYLSAVSGSFDFEGKYSGSMPNQGVEITYVYTYNGSGYEYAIKHKDVVNGSDIVAATITPQTPGDVVSASPGTFYGYNSTGITWDEDPLSSTAAFDSTGNYAATMPSDPLTVSYTYERDSSKWRDITFEPGLNGTLSADTVSNDVVAGLTAGTYRTSILVSDGTNVGNTDCYSWQELIDRNLIPVATANQYYLFGGWFIDTNGNGVMDGSETYLTTSDFFSTTSLNMTVTADFIEDPAWWIDIYFAAGARGSISGSSTYHTTKDQTWSSIPVTALPTGTAQVNYLIDDWYLGNSVMQGSELLMNAATYTLMFVQDPNIFGTALQTPDAVGNVDLDGSGMITVYDTTGGYQYVITDLDGNIVAVQTGSDLSSSLIFHDLYPGSRYYVYEVSLSETITLGSSISSVTSGNCSDPTEVLIPVVENNVSVLYDEEEDGKVKIVVDPADPNVSYALIDKDGNVVMTDGSDANGWVTPSGSNPTVEWGGLNANEEYTIVAVPNNQTGTDPLDKLADGTTIVADPAGEIDIPYFSIETMNGSILTCGEDGVGSDYYAEAKAGDEVTIYADAVNSDGYNFLYWKVVVGGGFSGKVTDQEITFTMPGTNVVLCAYYDRSTASPSNASVTEEVRGGNENEIALDPVEYEALENTLTTDEDRDLMDINGATITYKVVFNKGKVTTSELNILKEESSVYDDHPSAFTGAWSLDVLIERYVNGRKAGVASPSDASFDVIMQLDSDDVDMMDYELYELYDDGSGNTVAVLVDLSDDPEESGGLFRFTAVANCRYVLVYSKAFKVTVRDDVTPSEYYYRFKVRKGEAISDTAYYQEHYDEMRDMDSYWKSIYDWIDVDGVAHTWTDNDGVWYDYKGFSTNKLTSKFKEYDYDTPIKKATTIYAYYSNNREELLAKREELEQAIADAIKLSEDYFLTLAETAELVELIRQAQEILNQTDRRANYDELEAALYNLKIQQQPYEDTSEERHDTYDYMHSSSGSSSKGGSSGGGGTGSGTKSSPYIPVKGNTYTVGVNGSWEQLGENQWAFALTGGTYLRSMWAWLVYEDNGVDKTGWYHFNHAGIMNDGWFRDEAGNWFYCDTVNDGGFGRMKTGWHFDSTDQFWYYLDPASGALVTGWKESDENWYYFTEYNHEAAYVYDAAAERWYYANNSEKPVGSLYMSEVTPDGSQVDAQGAWIR